MITTMMAALLGVDIICCVAFQGLGVSFAFGLIQIMNHEHACINQITDDRQKQFNVQTTQITRAPGCRFCAYMP